jgi:hypothetical protein
LIIVFWQARRVLDMARFFFHAADGQTFEDEEGEQCTTREAAQAHATRIARELEAEGQFDAFAVKVTDEQGNEVANVPIGHAGRPLSRET